MPVVEWRMVQDRNAQLKDRTSARLRTARTLRTRGSIAPTARANPAGLRTPRLETRS